MIPATLTHVAVLVRSLDQAVAHIASLGLKINPFEEFEHEGTRECYIGLPQHHARLLLLEAIKDGPYRRALIKRGPGLHHIGVTVPNLEDYADQLGSAGWLLHTRSLATVRKQQTAYFARPKIPYLVEAWEHPSSVGPASIEHLQLSDLDGTLAARTQALGITNTIISAAGSSSEIFLLIEGRKIHLPNLTGTKQS